MRIEKENLGKKRFLFISHRTPVGGDFSLNDLPGSGGRVDVIARCVVSSLLTSNAIRRDTSASVFFSGNEGGLSVTISGLSVKYLNPDERSTSALLRNALIRGRKEQEGESSPGIYFSHQTLEECLLKLSEGCKVYYLREDGRSELTPAVPALFVIGDSQDLTKVEEERLAAFHPDRISVSSISQQSDQCAVIVNWLLDNSQLLGVR